MSDKGALQAVGALVKTLEDKLGVTAIEDALDKALGGKVVSTISCIEPLL